MQPIEKDNRYRLSVINGALHILSVGFEARCTAYLKFLVQGIPRLERHRVLCIDLGEDRLAPYLRERYRAHKQSAQQLFPALQFVGLQHVDSVVVEEVLQSQRAEKPICLDVSSMPRTLIWQLVQWTISRHTNQQPLYVIYTYPVRYDLGPLQRASPAFDELGCSRSEVCTTGLIVIPGFDLAHTDLTVCYARSKWCVTDEKIWWLFPFLQRYAFYERALETHLQLIRREDRYRLISQDCVGLAARQLKQLIEESPEKWLVAPLGPRITCLSVAVAAATFALSERLTVLIPRTAYYDSLRSVGAQKPLVENVAVLRSWSDQEMRNSWGI